MFGSGRAAAHALALKDGVEAIAWQQTGVVASRAADTQRIIRFAEAPDQRAEAQWSSRFEPNLEPLLPVRSSYPSH